MSNEFDKKDLENTEEVIEKDTEVYKCPSCGANLEFSAKNQQLSCSHCGTNIDFEKNSSVELVDFYSQKAPANNWSSETHMYRCNNCGAKEVVDKKDIAKICSFCNTTNIVETEELAGIKPSCVLPFKLAANEAGQSFENWLKKKWFKPKYLIQNSKMQKLNGVYSPTFVYNSNTFTDYTIHYGKHYYVTVGTGNNRRTVQRTRYYRARGNYGKDFIDLMIETSPFVDQKTQNALQPWKTAEAQVYDKKFLAGYVASSYEQDVNACFDNAKKIMENNIRMGITAKYHADVVVSLKTTTNYYKVNYRFMLLPIYLSNFSFKEKQYRFLVNGTNGKVTGKVPRSPLKITGFVLLLMGILGALIWIISLLLN